MTAESLKRDNSILTALELLLAYLKEDGPSAKLDEAEKEINRLRELVVKGDTP